MFPPFNPRTQSTPAIRDPVPCGTDANVAAGRESTQLGWYDFVASRHAAPVSVLDVGAGLGKGVQLFNARGFSARGIDTDARLAGIIEELDITPLANLTTPVFDIVTCIDVIEHVMEDIVLLRQLRSVLRDGGSSLYVTTPNFTRSQAANHHHARELTIPEFVAAFRPDELWVASPDGWLHRTKLLEVLPSGAYRAVHPRSRFYDCVVSLKDMDFRDTTVDGQEWPHMCGVWYG